MHDIIATTTFDCRDRNGDDFVATLQIGLPVAQVAANGNQYFECLIALEPLFPETRHGGEDSFQSLCLAIELVRKALRAFIAHGGAVYFHGTRSPIDIDDASFTPIAEPIRGLYLSELPGGKDDNRGWPNRIRGAE
jgi:hypothetical protein